MHYLFYMKSDTPQNAWLESFYANLKTLVDSAFPKTCPKCGKVYKDSQAFLTETIPVRDVSLSERSGLFTMAGASSVAAIGVFRNCICGTTMMADFQDRRDLSSKGNERRAQFEKVVDLLCERGLAPDEARLALRKLMRGEESPKVEELLGKIDLP